MNRSNQPHPRQSTCSRAALWGHPIHPMILPFPLAFLVGVLGADLAYALSRDPFWARAALYLLIAGLASGLLAALPGIIDFWSIRAARRSVGWVHALGNVAALGLAGLNLAIRWGAPLDTIPALGLWLSVATTLLLGVTGWAGGELSYRHRVGVDDRQKLE